MADDQAVVSRLWQGRLEDLHNVELIAIALTADAPTPPRGTLHLDELTAFEVSTVDAPGYVRPVFNAVYDATDPSDRDRLRVDPLDAPTADTTGAPSVARWAFAVNGPGADSTLEFVSSLAVLDHPGLAEDDIVAPNGIASVGPDEITDAQLVPATSGVAAGWVLTNPAPSGAPAWAPPSGGGGGATGAEVFDLTSLGTGAIYADLSTGTYEVAASTSTAILKVADGTVSLGLGTPLGAGRGPLGVYVYSEGGGAITVSGIGGNVTGTDEVVFVLIPIAGDVGSGMKVTPVFDFGGGGGGSGDVVGPASSVNNRVALFNGTTGKLLKDSGVTLGTAAPLNVAASGDAASGEVVKGSDTRLDVAATTHALTGKTTPVDADELLIVDSAASNVGKRLTWANVKATLAGAFVTKASYDANTILAATTDDTPVALTVAASRIVGRKATGDIGALTAAEVLAVLGLGARTVVRKPSDTTKTSDTTAASDPHLTVAVAASKTYLVKAQVMYHADTAADIKMLLGTPSGSTVVGTVSGAATAATALPTTAQIKGNPDTAQMCGGIGAGAVLAAEITATVVTTTSGSISVQWAQQSSNAVGTVVAAGSFIEVEEIP